MASFFHFLFGADGRAVKSGQPDDFIAQMKTSGATDLLFLAHGFRCQERDATALYNGILATLKTNRRLAVAGVYWPSERFPELPSIPVDEDGDPLEGGAVLKHFSMEELLECVPAAKLLNFMSWIAMKNLAGEVGELGLAPVVSTLRRQLPGVRIHLAGHSLGARLVTACCRQTQVDSLTLLEPAFSHYGFSPDAGGGQRGYFRDVIEKRSVRGPIVATFSRLDTVVGTAYAVASRLTRDRLQWIGDAADPYGGMGHNGAQKTPEARTTRLHREGETYQFEPGSVYCLDGSAGLISDHGDVTNPHVVWALASAITSSPEQPAMA